RQGRHAGRGRAARGCARRRAGGTLHRRHRTRPAAAHDHPRDHGACRYPVARCEGGRDPHAPRAARGQRGHHVDDAAARPHVPRAVGGAMSEPRICPNCGAPAPSRYCAECGQRQGARLVSMRRLVGEVIEDHLSLSGALPRTLVNLLARPGFLTAEYAAERIARYVAPFRLYLLASLTFFLTLTWVTDTDGPAAVAHADGADAAAYTAAEAGADAGADVAAESEGAAGEKAAGITGDSAAVPAERRRSDSTS